MTLQCARDFTVISLMLLAACRGDDPAPVDSMASATTTSPVGTVLTANTGWDPSVAGSVMLLSVADDRARAFIILPMLTDSALSNSLVFQLDSISNIDVELFGRGGLAGSTSLMVTAQQATDGCLAWPRGQLAEVPVEAWRIGFAKNTAASLPLDSLEAMTDSDSSLITREIVRLSSALTEGNDSTFHGLPFVVRKAFRFSLPTTSVLVGDVVRKINEEANPRAEHLLLIAERPTAGAGGYSAVFHTRVAGTEDAVRTTEVLAVLRFTRSKTPAIVVSFEYEDGGRVALLQRMGDDAWKITWRSAYTDC